MDDAYIIRAGGRDGFMDEAGNVVQAPVFEDMGPFHAGYAAYKLDGKWGVVHAAGVRHMAPLYDDILLQEGMEYGSPVRVGEHWGYAKLDGTLFIPALYKEAQSFSEGLAAVEDDEGVLSYVDEHGVQRFFRSHRWA